MTQVIHPTAIVEPGAVLGRTVRIGAYCVVGAGVHLGEGVELKSHVVVTGNTHIGENTVIYPFASIGSDSQDKKFKAGMATALYIGAHNVIREHVTINPGHTEPARCTRIGDHGLFMVGAHVAHDCQVGNHVIMANNATLAGHVTVGDHAVLGGLCAVHQFVRIGKFAMIGGLSGVEQDVIPFGLVMGERAALAGLNLIGLKRGGFSREQIHAVRNAYRHLFGATDTDNTFKDRLQSLGLDDDLVTQMAAFITAASDRGICQPSASAAATAIDVSHEEKLYEQKRQQSA